MVFIRPPHKQRWLLVALSVFEGAAAGAVLKSGTPSDGWSMARVVENWLSTTTDAERCPSAPQFSFQATPSIETTRRPDRIETALPSHSLSPLPVSAGAAQRQEENKISIQC